MLKGIGVVGLYVHDQDEALDFYVNKLGLRVHADHRNGNYRWLTVKHPNQPGFELGLFLPQEPVLDGATAQTMREMVAKGAMPPLVFVVEDCRASHKALSAKGVEFTQEPVARYGSVDALPRSFWQWLEDDPGTLVMCGHYIHPIVSVQAHHLELRRMTDDDGVHLGFRGGHLCTPRRRRVGAMTLS